MKPTIITLYHDTRREKQDGTYPVKLQVWSSVLRQRKQFGTGINLTEKDYNAATDLNSKKKPTEEIKAARRSLDDLMIKARGVADSLKPFAWDEFERLLFSRSADQDDLFFAFREAHAEFYKISKFATANCILSAYSNVLNFLDWKRGKRVNGPRNRKTLFTIDHKPLRFTDITVNWLNEFVSYMTEVQGSSRTTAINQCIYIQTMFGRNPSIKQMHYPFGKNKFAISRNANTKLALHKKELTRLFKTKPKSKALQKARDFFFLTYDLNGTNISDVLLLKWKNINFENEEIQWVREKSKDAYKKEVIIRAYMNDHIKMCIEKYGNKSRKPDEYVFDILNSNMTEKQKYAKRGSFGQTLNRNIQRLCKKYGIKPVVARSARHSWATSAINNGAPLGFVRDALGHTNSSTTDKYLAGLPTDAARKLSHQITRR